MIVVSLAYVAFVTPINLELGTNYGFIGLIPPFIDAMGPWPRRAVIVIGLAMIGFVVALLPWRMTSGCVELEAESYLRRANTAFDGGCDGMAPGPTHGVRIGHHHFGGDAGI